jgi:hypothetical protein
MLVNHCTTKDPAVLRSKDKKVNMSFNDDAVLMHLAMGFTLVDITQTGDVSAINSKTRNQQRNYETLIQVLGLRTQIITMSQPEKIAFNVTGSNFGSNFTGIQSIWTFKFGVESPDVYSDGLAPFGGLCTDFINVPIILELDESVIFPTSAFIVSGPNANIYFQALTI